MTSDPSIHIQGIYKTYAGLRALNGVDLELQKGKVTALIGNNGSGKSSLIRIIAGILEPDSGTVRFRSDGQEVRAPRTRMTVLFDGSPHLDKLDLMENMIFYAGCYGIQVEAVEERMSQLLNDFNLDKNDRRPVAQLSQGMRRKLALAQTLIPDADFIIMDEPGVNLDFLSRIVLYSLLRQRALKGAVVLISSNDLKEVADLADDIVILDKGQIMVHAPIDRLLAELWTEVIVEISLQRSAAVPMEKIYDYTKKAVFDEVGELILTFKKDASGHYPLPEAIKAIVEAGGKISNIKVREPEVGDIFLKYAGRALG